MLKTIFWNAPGSLAARAPKYSKRTSGVQKMFKMTFWGVPGSHVVAERQHMFKLSLWGALGSGLAARGQKFGSQGSESCSKLLRPIWQPERRNVQNESLGAYWEPLSARNTTIEPPGCSWELVSSWFFREHGNIACICAFLYLLLGALIALDHM